MFVFVLVWRCWNPWTKQIDQINWSMDLNPNCYAWQAFGIYITHHRKAMKNYSCDSGYASEIFIYYFFYQSSYTCAKSTSCKSVSVVTWRWSETTSLNSVHKVTVELAVLEELLRYKHISKWPHNTYK